MSAAAAPTTPTTVAPSSAVHAPADKVDRVHVYARFRPFSSLELEKDARSCTDYASDSVVAISNLDEGTVHKFSFQQVYQPETTQQAFYAAVGAPVVDDVLKGYNATIFAYGQTGSGKTYTMLGPPNSGGRISAASPLRRAVGGADEAAQGFDLFSNNSGIVPRVVHDLFDRIKKAPVTTKFTVRVSYVEIYMERIRDLFDATKTNLPLREDIANKRFWIDGCMTYDSTSAAEVLEYIDEGTKKRATAVTRVNDMSSRSHSIVTLEVTSTDDSRDVVLTGRLHLVDLAGSEKVSKTHAAGQQLDEAKLINKSLTTLSLVISNLTDPKSLHVPYRDSKLTRLLQDSLGGNARTSLIVCCSPSIWNISETISTLRFGSWATKVENHAVVNQELTPSELKALITKLEEEVRQLRARPAAAGAGNMTPDDMKTMQALREDAQQLVLIQRQFQRQSSALEALRETLNESTLREQLATRRADMAEAQLQLLEDECRAWELEYGNVQQTLAMSTAVAGRDLTNGELLRRVVVQAHDAIEASREELLAIRQHLMIPESPRRDSPASAAETKAASPTSSPRRATGDDADHRESAVSSPVRAGPPHSASATTGRAAGTQVELTSSFLVCVETQTATEDYQQPASAPAEGDVNSATVVAPALAADASFQLSEAESTDAVKRGAQLQRQESISTVQTPAHGSEAEPEADDGMPASVTWSEHDSAMRRATLAEQQLRALQDQWRELVSDSTAAKLELEFSTKRLQIRNERIDNLKAVLREKKAEIDALRESREREKRARSEELATARMEADAWKNETEKLRDIVGHLKHARSAIPNFVASQSATDDSAVSTSVFASPGRLFGSHFARQLHGGGGKSPGSSRRGGSATDGLGTPNSHVTPHAMQPLSPHVTHHPSGSTAAQQQDPPSSMADDLTSPHTEDY